jgi:hypothetical protein
VGSATSALVRGEDAVGVDLPLEPGQERGQASLGVRAALSVEGVGADARSK